MKGRPPGTPKSDNPEKRKRKRTARERDLCHVKIKVIEYFPRSEVSELDDPVEAGSSSVPGMYTFALGSDPSVRNVQTFGMLPSNPGLAPSHPGANGGRYYTIQRVNGNGANGKDDGVSGGHQHTLEESDRVKKSSVQRSVMKDKKERRTKVVRSSLVFNKRMESPHERGYVISQVLDRTRSNAYFSSCHFIHTI